MNKKNIITPKKPTLAKDFYCSIKLNKNQVDYGNLKLVAEKKKFREQTKRHITILSGSSLEKVRNILFESFEARLSKLSVWEQKDKKILVVEVEPKEKFQKIFGEVLLALRSDIVFDKSVFSEGLLPNFLPHITIDYDFNGDVSKLDKQELIKCFFAVDKMGLYREEERGRWIKCE